MELALEMPQKQKTKNNGTKKKKNIIMGRSTTALTTSTTVSSLPSAALSSHNNFETHNAGIPRTRSPLWHACPSALHHCSSHIYAPNQCPYAPRPRYGSTYDHFAPPTKSHLVSALSQLSWNVHPICHPTWTNHCLGHSSRPTCQCTLSPHLGHHTFLPTC